ncbi:hypothetical protein Barb4_01788 [Bacteroidales bacterium Barb4]|nr:hypothetical protein Barb4_01788 [Bacteroidales bacterium Barb4]
MHIRRMNSNGQKQSHCIDNDMPFSSPCLFTAVCPPAQTAAAGCFNGL